MSGRRTSGHDEQTRRARRPLRPADPRSAMHRVAWAVVDLGVFFAVAYGFGWR